MVSNHRSLKTVFSIVYILSELICSQIFMLLTSMSLNEEANSELQHNLFVFIDSLRAGVTIIP
jgi:hypothetical protein